ncbi:hypothetical protein HanXRQr2_Chr08g0358401 [Helianthus annuus]|uniref:Uncharacterized protein n=1 Tax=Helianthus annuus TaxID=4232 RepID=A0A9K3IIG7_HELAN|nr:hypothetical protein HanXRQr2_Chr08g0358401 [Helianthus annuus]
MRGWEDLNVKITEVTGDGFLGCTLWTMQSLRVGDCWGRRL